MNIKKEYSLFFRFFIVIFIINTIKKICKRNSLNQYCEDGENKNQSSEYEFSGGDNNDFSEDENDELNDYSNPQNEEINDLNGKDINSNNCPSCINKCPEVLQNSEKLIFEISDLFKKCKKEEKIAENIMKQNIKTIKNCIKQDLKYKKISKNYYKAINILSENIDICEKNKDVINSDCINNKNLVDIINKMY